MLRHQITKLASISDRHTKFKTSHPANLFSVSHLLFSTMTITTKTKEHISLKLLVKEESNKVLFAEAGKDFVDILCSFLTLPLGTIARLIEKDSDIGPVTVGCLNSLYHSVENLHKERLLLTERSKKMLLQPRNSSEHHCSTLKLNIDDTYLTKYFVCSKYDSCSSPRYLNLDINNDICGCGYDISRLAIPKSFGKGFVNDVATFVITDDLVVIPNSMDYTIYGLLMNFGIKDTSSLKEITVNLTKEKVLDLLKCIFLSKTPLTDVFLGEKPSLKRSMFIPGDVIVEDTNNNIQIILKLVVRKSNGKILYAQGDQDFADILLSFLTYPLGGVVRRLGGNSSLGNIDGLYKSITGLDEEKYFHSKEAKNVIVDPYLHPQYQLSKKISAIFDPRILKCYCYSQHVSYIYESIVPVQFFKADENRKVEGNLKEMQLNSPKSLEVTSEGYVKGPIVYVATDDLVISPLSPISACNLINRLKIPLSDLKEKVVTIGLKECLNILMASLSSSSALTDGLGHLLTDVVEKQVPEKQGSKTRSRSRRDA